MKPYISVDIEIKSEDVPEEVTEAVKKLLVILLQQQKPAIPFLYYDIQDL